MSTESLPTHQTVTHDGVLISLRSPAMAAFLAFLFPGAGHAYQGRNLKAGIYSVSILGLFFFGLWIGGGKVVYASWTDEDKRWQFIPQAAVGLPAAPAAVQAYWLNKTGRPLLGGFMAKPNRLAMLSEWHRTSSAGFDLGTLYTMIAGILNLLVIFDAYWGPMPPPKPKNAPPEPDEASRGDPTPAGSQ